LLAQYAKKYKINFKMDLSSHNISNYLYLYEKIEIDKNKIHSICFYNGETDILLYKLFEKFIISDDKNIYIKTNLFYNKYLVSDDIKKYINSFFIIKQEYYDKVNELIKNNEYKVLHIRCKDDEFNTEYTVMFDNWNRGKIRKEYITIKDMDFHVMNKSNFMELIV
jgi:hypothetical protein